MYCESSVLVYDDGDEILFVEVDCFIEIKGKQHQGCSKQIHPTLPNLK
jgi:hypothetical protein